MTQIDNSILNIRATPQERGPNSKLDLAPIVLFVYNRPWHTRQTVEALQILAKK